MQKPGLTSVEAAERLRRYGSNEPVRAERWSSLKELGRLLVNPLVLILLLAAVLSAAVGQRTDAVILIVTVVVSMVIDFVQSYRSQGAAERLRDTVAARATVLRDGQWQEILRREVAPGDVVSLSAGDLVPADATLLEAKDLHLQEAALTGESIPVEKAPGARIFLGTSVVSGTATAEVTATGAATEFGGIAARLVHKAPETAFEHDMRRFGLFITRAVLFLVLFLMLISIAARRDALESLLFAVALAVGLTPEFLPIITSVTLSAGAVRMSRENVIVKRLGAIQNLGSIDVLCCDKTGTLTAGVMALARYVDARGRDSNVPLELASVNSRFETGIRSPLDAAILERAVSTEGYRKLDEIPFDFERRRLSVVVERGGERRLITKGAPESIVPLCGAVDCRAVYEAMEAAGNRVLAVAHRLVPGKTAYSVDDETNLELAGFLAFADPPLPDAERAVNALRDDGVAVKVITGDSELVAAHLCTSLKLPDGAPVLGSEVEAMTDTALGRVAEQSTVFARVSPAQKTRILTALRHRGHTVGFMGDGINDAPSLRAADVGISVSGAVDVAREAADIILTKPGLQVLHGGIVEGRKASANVLKYLLMGTSSNFGNMFSMAVAAIFLPFLPMLPTQILLNNLIYDLAQISIPTDRVDEEYLRQPHRWNFGLIRKFMLYVGPVSSLYDLLTFYVLLHFFRAGEREFHTGWFVESLATQTLVLFVIRTAGNPLRRRASGWLTATTIGGALAALAIPYTPLAGPLGFVPLPGAYLAFVAAATAAYLLMVEFVKRRVM